MIIDDRMLIEIDAAVLTLGSWTWRRRRGWRPPGTRATTSPYAYFALSDCGNAAEVASAALRRTAAEPPLSTRARGGSGRTGAN